jgi:photosystem II stability/assembly factor-like uncharacterized protein
MARNQSARTAFHSPACRHTPLFALLALHLLAHAATAQWEFQPSGTTVRLRGVCAVSERVAWASGTGGTVVLTVDGGKTWDRRNVPGASDLDFRDIEAFDERTAYALSIGEGAQSRIDKTDNGGATWSLKLTNPDSKGFLDALAFWDADHGLVLGDPVAGRFVILSTDDGGKTWSRTASGGMPAALPGEGAFAASGTCLVVQGDRNAWFGTGGGRVFRSTDRGRSWTVHSTPISAGNGTSGIFSLAFWDADHGVALGGDFKGPDQTGKVCALSSDGGRTWRLPRGPGPSGYRSAVIPVPASTGPTLIAVGPTGSDRSEDGGETWTKLSGNGFHAASMKSPMIGWAVGEQGRVARWNGRSKSAPAP